MASPKSKLSVILSSTVIEELHGIWRWNAQRYGPHHADNYVSYLKQKIDDLASQFAQGKTVSIRPDLRYVLVRRKGRGHGHVVVYCFNDMAVDVMHVFHTAQDWQVQLKS